LLKEMIELLIRIIVNGNAAALFTRLHCHFGMEKLAQLFF